MASRPPTVLRSMASASALGRWSITATVEALIFSASEAPAGRRGATGPPVACRAAAGRLSGRRAGRAPSAAASSQQQAAGRAPAAVSTRSVASAQETSSFQRMRSNFSDASLHCPWLYFSSQSSSSLSRSYSTYVSSW
jgi:hypothetical protein